MDWTRCHRAVVRRAILAWPLHVALLGIGAGCVGESLPVQDGNVGLDPKLFPNRRIQGEPNDSFAEPVEVVFDASGHGHIAGMIEVPDDIDVFTLGPLAAGDRVIVDVGTPQGALDTAIALFDELGRVAFINDDRNFDLQQYDPFLNEVARYASSQYFLVVTSAPLGVSGTLTGSYEAFITLARGDAVPPTAGQIVVLDFDGGTVNVPGEGVFSAGAFNAADISTAYAGMTRAVRERIVATMLENYEGLDLEVRSVPGDPLPADEAYSTILFGGRNPEAVGVAESIDSYNADHGDDAVIFTDMFTPARFGRTLTATELGTAIGNVAAHELGHLLGLNHVANIFDLMDTTGDPSTFYLDQDFIDSPLHDSVFPIGSQDSLILLLVTLGAI